MSPATCILGIDPGITGGIAFLFPGQSLVAEDIPVAGNEVDVDTLAARVRQMRPTVAIIERAGAMPTDARAYAFRFGQAYGALRAVCAVLEIPTHIVTAAKWKKHFGLSSDKELSRALAIRLWPGVGFFSRKMDHGRAEAALLARYCAEVVLGS